MVKRTLTALVLASACVGAEPTGPRVIHGGVQIQTQGAATQIHQTTDRAIINWNGFNVDVHELVRFIQPNQLSVILNRVVGSDPSSILGQLQANGRVFLINPNGIVFGPSARVDVGGLMASTLSLSDQDFLQGNYRLVQEPGAQLTAVVNQGELKVAEGGFLLLVAPLVSNEGLIVARAGQVGLVGSTQATVNFDGQGLIEVTLPPGRVDQPGTVVMPSQAVSEILREIVTEPEIAQATRLPGAEGLVVHSGQIATDGPEQGGRVLLQSSQASVVSPEGRIEARGAARGGEVRILSEGTSYLAGQVQASGRQGGFVELSGRDFALHGEVDVSGSLPGRFLIDPATVTVVDSYLPAPLDDLLPNILLGDDAGINQVSRYALEAQPEGSHITIEAENLITVEDMAGDLISLARDVYLNFYVAHGDLIFQDPYDSISIQEGGGISIQLPGGGSSSLGNLLAPGGSIQIQAAHDLVLNYIDTAKPDTNGPVTIQTQGNLYLSTISGGVVCLEAGQSIYNEALDSALNVMADSASFVAGNRVGSSADPITTSVYEISGLANEFHFDHTVPPVETQVCGIDGLNLRPPPNPAPEPTAAPTDSPNILPLLASRVNQVPLFQISEQTGAPLQPPPVPESPQFGDSEFGLGGLALLTRLSPTEFRYTGDDVLPLLELLSQRGWQVGATDERVFARKDNLTMMGVIEPGATRLSVGPRPILDLDQPLRDSLAFVGDLNGYQVTSEERVADNYRIQFEASDIMPFFDGLWQRGWVVRLTSDRVSAHKEGLTLQGERTAWGARVQVRRETQPEPHQDLDQVLQRLTQTQQPQQIEVNPYSLVTLLETLAQQGWVARLTGDRLLATQGDQQITASLDGATTATLQLVSKAPSSPPVSDSLAFLANLPGLDSREFLSDYQRFTYHLGNRGMMPWIEAFRERGFRLGVTAERFQARRGEVQVMGAVVGATFVLKVGPPQTFQAEDVDHDLRQSMEWLLASVKPLSQQRLVDQNVLEYPLASLNWLRQQFTRRGWVFSRDGLSATRQRLSLKISHPPGTQTVTLTLGRRP
jgi:filamentous hemagglutinin family protein